MNTLVPPAFIHDCRVLESAASCGGGRGGMRRGGGIVMPANRIRKSSLEGARSLSLSLSSYIYSFLKSFNFRKQRLHRHDVRPFVRRVYFSF